jgi:RNA polymerase sigma-32 factor
MDNLQTYLKQIKATPNMYETEIKELFQDISKTHKRIVKGNLRLVVKIAFETWNGWQDQDVMDLIQEGNIALIKAVKSFDIDRGYQFTTYATYAIRNAMLHWIKTNGVINLYKSKDQRLILNKMAYIKKQLEDHGATVESMAEELDVSVCDIQDMTDHNVVDITDPNIESELLDYNTPETITIKNETTEILWQKIVKFRSTLGPIERYVFDNRMYQQRMTLSEIMETLKLKHTEQVRRIEDKVYKKALSWFVTSDLNDIVEG